MTSSVRFEEDNRRAYIPPFNSQSPRFPEDKPLGYGIKTPGPGYYNTIEGGKGITKQSSAFKSEDRNLHSFYGMVEKKSNSNVGPGSYKLQNGLLKKSQNVTLPQKNFI